MEGITGVLGVIALIAAIMGAAVLASIQEERDKRGLSLLDTLVGMGVLSPRSSRRGARKVDELSSSGILLGVSLVAFGLCLLLGLFS